MEPEGRRPLKTRSAGWARAVAAGRTGTYKAWLSDNTGSPSSRFTRSAAPYVRLDGAVLANNWADLTDGTIQVNFNITETGATQGSTTWPFTNTNTNGTLESGGYSCSNWTATSGPTSFGCNNYTDRFWTFCWSGSNHCGGNYTLYCFEQ